MPKFFLPLCDDPEAVEHNYDAIRRFNAEQAAAPLSDRRIFRLDYVHNGMAHYAEVGKPESGDGELVIAIFKQQGYPLYYVCTPNRGVVRGGPILVGENEVRSCVDFEK